MINDTIVFPNWDDIAFLDTSEQDYRGGIWTESRKRHMPVSEDSLAVVAEEVSPSSTGSRKVTAATVADGPNLTIHDSDMISNEDLDSFTSFEAGLAESVDPTSTLSDRSTTSSTAHVPLGSDLDDYSDSAVRGIPNAAQGIVEIHDDSVGNPGSTIGSLTSQEDADSVTTIPPTADTGVHKFESGNGSHARNTDESRTSDQFSYAGDRPIRPDIKDSPSGYAEADGAKEDASQPPLPLNKRILTATTAARKWGTTFLQRQHDGLMRSDDLGQPQEPMGRGSPLPPPGQPLPGPPQKLWTTPALKSIKRKSISTSGPSLAESTSTGK